MRKANARKWRVSYRICDLVGLLLNILHIARASVCHRGLFPASEEGAQKKHTTCKGQEREKVSLVRVFEC